MTARHLACAALVAASLGCSYDYNRLRDADAAVDRPAADRGPAVKDVPPTPMDMGMRPDVQDAGTPVDRPVGPTRDAMTGPCTTHPFEELSAMGTRFGQGFVVRGSTDRDAGAPATLTPPGMSGAGCGEAMYGPSPERVYRYVVQRGPRLVATLNGSPCDTHFDSMLYALPSCDGALRPLGCNDDDGRAVCMSCTAGDAGVGSQCPHAGYLSTLEVPNLVPGDVVYLVVDGYAGTPAPRSAGPFRLSVAENALLPASPPTAAGVNVAERCNCAPTRPGMALSVPFPGGFPGDTSPATLDMTNRSMTGLRTVALGSITGVAASFRVRQQNVQLNSNCVNATTTPRMTLDLLVENTVVSSFQVAIGLDGPVQVNVLYSSFQPVSLRDRTMVPFELRVREVTPQPDCMSISIEPNAIGSMVSTVTLEGTL